MGTLDGRVALITGAARGQGRAHALALAAEGASIIACDIADQIDGVPYAMATEPDLAETVKLVTDAGGTCIAERVDVRSRAAVEQAWSSAAATNSAKSTSWSTPPASCTGRAFADLTESDWHDVIDVNLHGSVNTAHAVLPGHGRAAVRPHRVHRLHARPDRRPEPGQLLGVQMGPARPGQMPGHRVRGHSGSRPTSSTRPSCARR